MLENCRVPPAVSQRTATAVVVAAAAPLYSGQADPPLGPVHDPCLKWASH